MAAPHHGWLSTSAGCAKAAHRPIAESRIWIAGSRSVSRLCGELGATVVEFRNVTELFHHAWNILHAPSELCKPPNLLVIKAGPNAEAIELLETLSFDGWEVPTLLMVSDPAHIEGAQSLPDHVSLLDDPPSPERVIALIRRASGLAQLSS